MLWIIIFLLFFILTVRIRKIHECLQRCIGNFQERRYKKELVKEWKEIFPDVPIHQIHEVFDYYGLISPWEYINAVLEDRELWLKSIEQIIELLIHFNKILWRSINRLNKRKSIREILRKQIKVIDDEELVLLPLYVQ